MRGPFEPAARPRTPSAAASWPADAAMATSPPAGSTGSPQPTGPAAALASPPARAPLPSAAAKLEQIKDLYLTAEAIGEDALATHFQQVSERQRQLIREYFDQAIKGAADGR